MSPNFLSVFMGLLILFPYLFNFFIFFQYQKYYTIYDAFLYYVGLLLSSIIGLVIKKLLSFSVSKTGHMAHLRLDLIVNALKKIVINKKKACSIIENPIFPNLGILSLHSLFYGYVIGYLCLIDIMKGKSNGSMNLMFIGLLTFSIIYSSMQIHRGCNRIGELFLGWLVGLGCGISWYFLVNKSEQTSDIKMRQLSKEKRCKFYGNKYMCSKDI
tara:strand:+ start:372 stop:1013 length:642 start_codon:yes stop_codon:yes gene_type:complete